MTAIQGVLDSILRKGGLRSIQDLEYYEPDGMVIVRKKLGYRNCLIDVSQDSTEEDLRAHLEATGLIF